MFIFEDLYKNINFFKNKSSSFISWACPLLKPSYIQTMQFIFLEQDHAKCLYFIKEGQASYVLPAYNNTPFITVKKGNMVGALDIQGTEHRANFESNQTQIVWR